MCLPIWTIVEIINETEILLKLYFGLSLTLNRKQVGPLLSEKTRVKIFVKIKNRGYFRRCCRSTFGSKRILNNSDFDICLLPHGRVRNSVISPGKIDNNVLPEGATEKGRSPIPLPPDGSPNAAKLSPESNSQQTAQWLRKNSFGNYVTTFASFTGADILRLTRDDLIQICGLADGIRLLYALHAKAIVRLTLYICTPASGVYHAVYLDHMGRTEMSRKLANLLGVQQSHIQDIFLQGPNDIKVLVTDEVISNIKDESMFTIEVLKDESRGRFVLLLKPNGPTT